MGVPFRELKVLETERADLEKERCTVLDTYCRGGNRISVSWIRLVRWFESD